MNGHFRLTQLDWRENAVLVAFSFLFTINIAISNVSLYVSIHIPRPFALRPSTDSAAQCRRLCTISSNNALNLSRFHTPHLSDLLRTVLLHGYICLNYTNNSGRWNSDIRRLLFHGHRLLADTARCAFGVIKGTADIIFYWQYNDYCKRIWTDTFHRLWYLIV